MKMLLLLAGALACAQASFIDLNNITTSTDALAYVLNLKCIQAQFYTWAAHGKGLDIGLLGYNRNLGLDGKNLAGTKVLSALDNHFDYKTSCQEYTDCPLQCQDQPCKDQCLLKTCYYYHCSTYKTCFDACADQTCRNQCSYKGCDYGLTNSIQGQIDQDIQAQGQLANGALNATVQVQKGVDKDVTNQVNGVGKQQAAVDSAIANDANNQQKAVDATVANVGKQQAAVDKAIGNDVANQVNSVGKQQAAVDSAVGNDLNNQQKAVDATIANVGKQQAAVDASIAKDAQNQQKAVGATVANVGKQQAAVDKAVGSDVANQVSAVGKQQAAVDRAIGNDLTGQQKAVDATVANIGKQQAAVDNAIVTDVANQQKAVDATVANIGKQVAKDVVTQQQFLDQFVGGQKAQLSHFVQLVAEQLSWADAEHIKVLRGLLGDQAPECPKLDISVDVWNKIIMQALGNPSGLTSKFSPYYDDASFMAAAYLFEDLSVSAYTGILDQLAADAALQLQLVRILSVDSYQSGLVRSWLFNNGAYPLQWFSNLQVVDLVQKISDLRYKLGAGQDEGVTIPKAQGGLWVPLVTTPAYKLAIAPTDEAGLIYYRKPTDVANILYGGDYQKPGLFFPEGLKLSL